MQTNNILLNISSDDKYKQIICYKNSYLEVWKNIKKIFSYYNDFDVCIDKIINCTSYKEKTDKDHNYLYIADIIVEDTIIDIKVYMREYYDNKITCYCDRYITKSTNEGNCIDDFIQKGIESRLVIINELVNSIKSRMLERQLQVEYHNTLCYEKDFTQISLLKSQAQKIVNNCDKQLERLSEKYTKL